MKVDADLYQSERNEYLAHRTHNLLRLFCSTIITFRKIAPRIQTCQY